MRDRHDSLGQNARAQGVVLMAAAEDWPLDAAMVLLRGLTEGVREPQCGLPPEILRLDAGIAMLVVAIGGVDYAITVTAVPRQRPRPVPQ